MIGMVTPLEVENQVKSKVHSLCVVIFSKKVICVSYLQHVLDIKCVSMIDVYFFV